MVIKVKPSYLATTKPSNLSTPSTMSPLFGHDSWNVIEDRHFFTPEIAGSNRVSSVTHSSLGIQEDTLNVDKNIKGVNNQVRSNITSWNTDKEFNKRRVDITKAIDTQIIGLSNKEVVIGNKGLFGKIKLGFNSLGSDIKSIYIKYDNIGRGKFL